MFIHNLLLSNWQHLVLNPCISYEGLKMDYKNDSTLSTHLEDLKTSLFDYFNDNYAALHNPMPSSLPSTPVQTPPATNDLPQKSYTAQYHQKMKYSTNKLEEYFKLPPEDFQRCNPIQWWVGRQGQFPCLFQLAHNILCIPS